jgi:ADP-dependent NAD(P)H-hydrate dehydratase / NAD(P)H-hydrate epimerase
MTGAACLSASAGLQAGAGLVGIVAHSCVGPIYRMRERALIVADADTPEAFDALLREKKPDAMVIGPGFGRRNDTKELVSMVLSLTDRAVLDADALTAFAADPNELFAQLTTNHVLTPHEGEFTRLFPDLKGTRIEQAREAAQRCGAIMVLKGRDTLIAHPNGAVIINANAPNNLAMGGSGDVLAGIIGGLLARGMGEFMAAAAGVWFHGEAGKLAGNGAIADDLLDHLRAVIG